MLTFYRLQNWALFGSWPSQKGRGSIPDLTSRTDLHAIKSLQTCMQNSLWRQIRNRPMPLLTRSCTKWCLVFRKFWKPTKCQDLAKMVKNRQMRFKQTQRCIVVKKYFGVRCTLIKLYFFSCNNGNVLLSVLFFLLLPFVKTLLFVKVIIIILGNTKLLERINAANNVSRTKACLKVHNSGGK